MQFSPRRSVAPRLSSSLNPEATTDSGIRTTLNHMKSTAPDAPITTGGPNLSTVSSNPPRTHTTVQFSRPAKPQLTFIQNSHSETHILLPNPTSRAVSDIMVQNTNPNPPLQNRSSVDLTSSHESSTAANSSRALNTTSSERNRLPHLYSSPPKFCKRCASSIQFLTCRKGENCGKHFWACSKDEIGIYTQPTNTFRRPVSHYFAWHGNNPLPDPAWLEKRRVEFEALKKVKHRVSNHQNGKGGETQGIEQPLCTVIIHMEAAMLLPEFPDALCVAFPNNGAPGAVIDAILRKEFENEFQVLYENVTQDSEHPNALSQSNPLSALSAFSQRKRRDLEKLRKRMQPAGGVYYFPLLRYDHICRALEQIPKTECTRVVIGYLPQHVRDAAERILRLEAMLSAEQEAAKEVVLSQRDGEGFETEVRNRRDEEEEVFSGKPQRGEGQNLTPHLQLVQEPPATSAGYDADANTSCTLEPENQNHITDHSSILASFDNSFENDSNPIPSSHDHHPLGTPPPPSFSQYDDFLPPPPSPASPVPFNIPDSLYSQLLPYQKKGVQFGIERHGRILLGDEMGLGKTVQALAIALHYSKEWPLLVLCPASLKQVWRMEIKRWLPAIPEDKVFVAQPKTGKSNKVKNTFSNTNEYQVCIIPYSLVSPWKETLLQKRFHVILLDESHYLKNVKAQRVVATQEICKAANRVVLLSGTAILARPIELFPQIDLLCPGWMSYHKYGQRYCDPDAVWQRNMVAQSSRNGYQTPGRKKFNSFRPYEGHSCVAELHWFLHRQFFLRRRKSDVLPQLPPKRRQEIMLEISEKEKEGMHEQLEALKEAQERERWELELTWENGSFQGNPNATALYYTTSLAKGPAVCEYLSYLLDGGLQEMTSVEEDCATQGIEYSNENAAENRVSEVPTKFLLFGYHREMLNRIEAVVQEKEKEWDRRRAQSHRAPAEGTEKQKSGRRKRTSNGVSGEAVRSIRNLRDLPDQTSESGSMYYSSTSSTPGNFEDATQDPILVGPNYSEIGSSLSYIRIDGETPMESRSVLVEKFQTDPNCRVAILSLAAAATGLNFTAASFVVFAELFWTPAVMLQAEDRIHRIGQKASHCTIQYLLVPGTMDDVLWPMLVKKVAVTSSVLDQNPQPGLEVHEESRVVPRNSISEDGQEESIMQNQGEKGDPSGEKQQLVASSVQNAPSRHMVSSGPNSGYSMLRQSPVKVVAPKESLDEWIRKRSLPNAERLEDEADSSKMNALSHSSRNGDMITPGERFLTRNPNGAESPTLVDLLNTSEIRKVSESMPNDVLNKDENALHDAREKSLRHLHACMSIPDEPPERSEGIQALEIGESPKRVPVRHEKTCDGLGLLDIFMYE